MEESSASRRERLRALREKASSSTLHRSEADETAAAEDADGDEDEAAEQAATRLPSAEGLLAEPASSSSSSMAAPTNRVGFYTDPLAAFTVPSQNVKGGRPSQGSYPYPHSDLHAKSNPNRQDVQPNSAPHPSHSYRPSFNPSHSHSHSHRPSFNPSHSHRPSFRPNPRPNADHSSPFYPSPRFNPSPILNNRPGSSYNQGAMPQGLGGRGRGGGRREHHGPWHGGGGRAVSAMANPELFAKQSMLADPWKDLVPVQAHIGDCLPKSTAPSNDSDNNRKKLKLSPPPISATTAATSSNGGGPSLADSLAASLSEAVNADE